MSLAMNHLDISQRSSDGSLLRSSRKVAFASFIGTTIEWYDFFIFGTAAALIFNEVFFPSFDPVTGTLAAFASFSVGFIANRDDIRLSLLLEYRHHLALVAAARRIRGDDIFDRELFDGS